jgi:tight adherence protein C
VITLVLAGAAIGAGLVYLMSLLRPDSKDPLVHLARFDAARAAGATPIDWTPGARRGGLQDRIGGWLARELQSHGIANISLRQDLALTGKTYETMLGRKVLVGVLGFVFGLAAAVAFSKAGIALPVGTPVLLALGSAVGFFMVPDIEARAGAAKRRRQFRTVLSVYLTWVSLQMAGRVSSEAALPQAASVGGGWPLAVIRHTLTSARRSGRDVWTEMSLLGERIGVPQLRDLGALIGQVSHDGARVRDTLTARADSMASEALAEAQTEAAKRDQAMLGAELLIGIGFAVFLGYPAIHSFLHH